MKTRATLSLTIVVLLVAPALRAQDALKTDDEGFIRNWLILAPIPCQYEEYGSVEVNKEQIREEGNVRPREGEKITVGSRELAWKAHRTPDYYIDFKEFVGQGQSEDVIGYAVAYVIADAEMKDVKLLMGSNDQAKVYLNGKPVLKFLDTRTLDKDQETASDLTLNKGANVVVFKVVNEKNNWQGCIRFADKNGVPLKNLKVALTPQ